MPKSSFCLILRRLSLFIWKHFSIPHFPVSDFAIEWLLERFRQSVEMCEDPCGFQPPSRSVSDHKHTIRSDPDFLLSLLELMSLMRLSVKKAAYADVSRVAYRKPGDSNIF